LLRQFSQPGEAFVVSFVGAPAVLPHRSDHFQHVDADGDYGFALCACLKHPITNLTNAALVDAIPRRRRGHARTGTEMMRQELLGACTQSSLAILKRQVKCAALFGLSVT